MNYLFKVEEVNFVILSLQLCQIFLADYIYNLYFIRVYFQQTQYFDTF